MGMNALFNEGTAHVFDGEKAKLMSKLTQAQERAMKWFNKQPKGRWVRGDCVGYKIHTNTINSLVKLGLLEQGDTEGDAGWSVHYKYRSVN